MIPNSKALFQKEQMFGKFSNQFITKEVTNSKSQVEHIIISH